MAQVTHVGYIGLDQRYWRRFKGDFTDEYSKVLEPSFYQYEHLDTKDFPAIIKAILDRPCHILYLDFSDQFDLILKLSTTLQRLNCFNKMVIIGMFSMNEFTKMEVNAFPIGLTSLHLKSSEETRDAIYSGVLSAFPSLAKKPGTYNLNLVKGKDYTVFEICRVNFAHATGLHLECCVPFKPSESVKLPHNVCRDLVKSDELKVKSIDPGPLYYDSKIGVSLDFEFINTIDEAKKNSADKMEKARIMDAIELRKGEVAKVKVEYLKWLEEKVKDSVPKRTKLLIIDPTFNTIAQRDSLLWDSTFSFRIQTHLLKPDAELQSYLPDFIAMEYCETPYAPPMPAAAEAQNNAKPDPKAVPFEQDFLIPPLDDSAIRNIVSAIQKIPNYSPILVLFGKNNLSSEQARTQYTYAKVVVAQGPISTHTLVDMAKTFDKKSVFFKDTKSLKLFFSKRDPLSFCNRPVGIKLLNISEFELYFECDLALDQRCRFKAVNPVHFFFTIAPIPSTSPFANRRSTYRGIIQLLSRQQIEDLRKFIIKKDT
ncbi:MAG: hypothetical protein A2X86_01015 [Bdellovibrionales bacterium GWA2_49_15]|nr:MAG: hypothetical protein A2X86_01015 [Bdellovibrionales bacterium GWA2_49_15]HAZ11748.1 hypothetical protein [Bdellovibrionales bacterium]